MSLFKVVETCGHIGGIVCAGKHVGFFNKGIVVVCGAVDFANLDTEAESPMVVEHVLVLESAHEAKSEVVSAIDGLVEHGVDATTKISLSGFDNCLHLITVYNSFGTQVLRTTFNGNEFTLDMTNMPYGTYMINVDGETSKTIKL